MENFDGMSEAGRQIVAEAVIDVDAPAAQAWAVIADYACDVRWRAGVRSMVPAPPGPVRVGTTTSEVLRAAGRTTYNDGVVTEVEPGRRFAWHTTSGVDASGSRSVTPSGDEECRIRLTVRVTPPGLLRLVPWALARMVRRGLERDAARLRALIELDAPDDRPGGADLTESGFTSGSADDRDGSLLDR